MDPRIAELKRRRSAIRRVRSLLERAQAQPDRAKRQALISEADHILASWDVALTMRVKLESEPKL